MNDQPDPHRYRAGPPRPHDTLYSDWALVVGDRMRRLRIARSLTLEDLSELVRKPATSRSSSSRYSPGYFSRIERGWPTAPMYVYLAISDALEVEPGRLFGPDDAQTEVSQAEMTLVRVLRGTGISPDEALVRLSAGAPRGE